jgi:hypothetical protein
MESKRNSNNAPEKVDDVMDQESLLLDTLSFTREFHFSFSSMKSTHDDEIHVSPEEKALDNSSQDQCKTFDDADSISISIKGNESDFRVDQRNEPRNDFSLSSLDSDDFFEGLDSILVAKRRASRKLQLRRRGTSNDSWFNESYDSTQSSNRVR